MSPQEQRAELCLAYLLGELSSIEAAELEQQLAENESWNQELQRQADLLCTAATETQPEPVVALAASPTAPWRITTMVSALAACIALLVGLSNLKQPDRSPQNRQTASELEATEIAIAWAANRRTVTESLDSLGMPAEEVVDESMDPIASDSTLSWMVTAITADIDGLSLSEGEPSDG